MLRVACSSNSTKKFLRFSLSAVQCLLLGFGLCWVLAWGCRRKKILVKSLPVHWYFKFWFSSLFHLSLFTFQSSQISALFILSMNFRCSGKGRVQCHPETELLDVFWYQMILICMHSGKKLLTSIVSFFSPHLFLIKLCWLLKAKLKYPLFHGGFSELSSRADLCPFSELTQHWYVLFRITKL